MGDGPWALLPGAQPVALSVISTPANSASAVHVDTWGT